MVVVAGSVVVVVGTAVVVVDAVVLVVEVVVDDVVVVGTGSDPVEGVVVEVVVVVDGGDGHVHSLGEPGMAHWPGHAASPFGAVTSHCSPGSSFPLPHVNASKFLSFLIVRATKCPDTRALLPTRRTPFGAKSRALNVALAPVGKP